ncbi:MAG TPA: ribosome recycling factor [Sphingobacteriaceae bacterium]|nr:ribosome recycling factor [Sphingobacteriaceae bacterium]
MSGEILQEAEQRMQAAVEALRRDLVGIRAGRATPALLDKVRVEVYGTVMPLNQVASITVPEPRLIVVQPWDQSSLADVERAILKSDLGLTPNNDGKVIRLTLPQLTQERRAELARQVKKMGEDARVAVRNARRAANDDLKSAEKDGALSKDEAHRLMDQVQKLTDRYIDEIDAVVAEKEKDIMEG